jgi:hypothetical protein
LCAAIFILAPIPNLVGAPSVIAQQMRIDKPDKLNDEPRGDGCIRWVCRKALTVWSTRSKSVTA